MKYVVLLKGIYNPFQGNAMKFEETHQMEEEGKAVFQRLAQTKQGEPI